MVQFVVDHFLEWPQVVIINDKAILIQRLRVKNDLGNIVVSMQAAAFVCVRESLNNMAATEVKLFADSIHSREL